MKFAEADIEGLVRAALRCYALKLSVDVEKAAIDAGAPTTVTMQARAAVFEKFLTGDLDGDENLCGAGSAHRSGGELRSGGDPNGSDTGGGGDAVQGFAGIDR
jgi:hypothetical protein